MKLLSKIESALSIVFVILLVFSIDTPSVAILTILSAIIHEIGHIIPATLLSGAKITAPIGRADGFRIYFLKNPSYKNEILITLGGPLMNLIFALIFLFLYLKLGTHFGTFAFVNFMTAVSNLLPIRQYDGYRIIRAIIMKNSKRPFEKICVLDAFSFLFCTVIAFLSLYVILKLGTGFWIFSLLILEVLKSIRIYNGD